MKQTKNMYLIFIFISCIAPSNTIFNMNNSTNNGSTTPENFSCNAICCLSLFEEATEQNFETNQVLPSAPPAPKKRKSKKTPRAQESYTVHTTAESIEIAQIPPVRATTIREAIVITVDEDEEEEVESRNQNQQSIPRINRMAVLLARLRGNR